MTSLLEQSYRTCECQARRSGSNFYYSFFLLSPAKRRAMAALYAFLRHTDDLGDDETIATNRSLDDRRRELDAWRHELTAALAGETGHPLLPALADTVRRFSIPSDYLHAVITGVEMDLSSPRFETFSELEDYCYHVASAVGLACLHIWGYSDPAAVGPAKHCGIAFQLTNILRDLYPDATAGRIYLPLEDLRQFGCPVDDWPKSAPPERLRELLCFEIARAKSHYAQAELLQQYLHPDGRRIFLAMFHTYRSLLDRVQRRDVELSWPVRLSRLQKLWFLGRSWMAGPPRPKSLQRLTEAAAK